MDFGTRLHRLLDDVLGRVVALAKRDGWGLARMGRLLGHSRQTMHRKFRTIRPALPYDPDADQQEFNRRFTQLRDPHRRQADSGDEVVPW